MTSRSSTPSEDSTHTATTIGTATVTVTMTITIGATPVTVTMTIMIGAAQATATDSNNVNDYSRDISETVPPSDILPYGDINEWSSQFYAPSQPALLPAVTIPTSNEVGRSNVQEHNEFSSPALSPLTNLSLNSSPPLIPFPHYSNDILDEVDYYNDGSSPELTVPIFATAITSTTTTVPVPVQQSTNDTPYSSLLTDPFEPSSSALVFEENQEGLVQQEDTYISNDK